MIPLLKANITPGQAFCAWRTLDLKGSPQRRESGNIQSMPEALLEIRVSRRELDRPRLLQASAVRADGTPFPELEMTLVIDANGSFSDDKLLERRELSAKADGYAIFQWYEWPRDGDRRDLVSHITATWLDESAFVYLEDLYE